MDNSKCCIIVKSLVIGSKCLQKLSPGFIPLSVTIPEICLFFMGKHGKGTLIRWMPGLLIDGNEVEIRTFLERSLDIVIGIEFIKMLAKHSPGGRPGSTALCHCPPSGGGP